MNDEIEKTTELTSIERFRSAISRAKNSANNIMEKALEDKALLEEIEIDLEELAEEMKGKETELLGTDGESPIVDEVEEEAIEYRIDDNPNSPTYNQQILHASTLD